MLKKKSTWLHEEGPLRPNHVRMQSHAEEIKNIGVDPYSNLQGENKDLNTTIGTSPEKVSGIGKYQYM